MNVSCHADGPAVSRRSHLQHLAVATLSGVVSGVLAVPSAQADDFTETSSGLKFLDIRYAPNFW